MKGKSGRRWPRPRLACIGAVFAIPGIVALAACGGTGTTAGGDSSTSSAYQKALAYAQCIRAHGIPGFPDPNSKGEFVVPNGSSPPKVSSAVQNAATRACQKLLPPAMASGPPQGSQGASNKSLQFAECMRSHGATNYPDPNPNGSFTLPKGANPESPQWQAAEKDCQKLMPANPGGSAP
jgi:hypothetical protein